jgi:hypothetical protein
VPAAYYASRNEILAEYAAGRGSAVTLLPPLKIKKPYQLLTPDEVAEFIEIHRLRRTPVPNPNPTFAKAADLYYLGDVYFNSGRSLALTSLTSFCGSLCGATNWKVFEKTTRGVWEQRPEWVSCHGAF